MLPISYLAAISNISKRILDSPAKVRKEYYHCQVAFYKITTVFRVYDRIYTMSTKSKPKLCFAMTLKIVHKFQSNLANSCSNTKQC